MTTKYAKYFWIIVSVTLLLIGIASTSPVCLEGQKLRTKENGEHICCITIVCNTSQQFGFCSEDGGYDTCTDCGPNQYNNDRVNTADTDSIIEACVTIPECKADEVTLVGHECQCNLGGGYYGTDFNNCKLDSSCIISGHQLAKNGSCVPCDANQYKSESNQHGLCKDKKKCQEDEVEVTPGTKSTDRVCKKREPTPPLSTTEYTGTSTKKAEIEINNHWAIIIPVIIIIVVLLAVAFIGCKYRERISEFCQSVRNLCNRQEAEGSHSEIEQIIIHTPGAAVENTDVTELSTLVDSTDESKSNDQSNGYILPIVNGPQDMTNGKDRPHREKKAVHSDVVNKSNTGSEIEEETQLKVIEDRRKDYKEETHVKEIGVYGETTDVYEKGGKEETHLKEIRVDGKTTGIDEKDGKEIERELDPKDKNKEKNPQNGKETKAEDNPNVNDGKEKTMASNKNQIPITVPNTEIDSIEPKSDIFPQSMQDKSGGFSDVSQSTPTMSQPSSDQYHADKSDSESSQDKLSLPNPSKESSTPADTVISEKSSDSSSDEGNIPNSFLLEDLDTMNIDPKTGMEIKKRPTAQVPPTFRTENAAEENPLGHNEDPNFPSSRTTAGGLDVQTAANDGSYKFAPSHANRNEYEPYPAGETFTEDNNQTTADTATSVTPVQSTTNSTITSTTSAMTMGNNETGRRMHYTQSGNTLCVPDSENSQESSNEGLSNNEESMNNPEEDETSNS